MVQIAVADINSGCNHQKLSGPLDCNMYLRNSDGARGASLPKYLTRPGLEFGGAAGP